MSGFQQVWENEIYSQGRHLNRYPYDAVVSFIFRNAPRDIPRADVRALEIGCGAGNNIWFLAREGFAASGMDGSASAIDYCRQRLAADRLHADLQVGDFTSLPYNDKHFHLAIERGALVCVGRAAACRAILELYRVLKPGGRFLANPYSSEDPAASQGEESPEGLRVGIREGPLAGLGGLCFWDQAEAVGAFALGWNLLGLEHCHIRGIVGGTSHAEWRITLEKNDEAPACLRPACELDCMQILEWRNHPYIVERSTSREKVAVDVHRKWFFDSFRHPDHLLLIVEGAAGPMGLIRFARSPRSTEAVLTIYLLPEFTGRGMGPLLVRKACEMAALRKAGLSHIVAHVRKDNRPGQSCFRKAGFQQSEEGHASTPPAHLSFLFRL